MSVKGFLDDHYEKCRQEFYSHVRPWIVIGVEMAKATGWRMSYDEYRALIDFLDGMNSYERKVLLPVLDDLAVCELTEYCMSQYRTLGELDVAVVYDEAVQRELAPLLVKRLRESGHQLETALENLDTARKQTATWEIQAQDLRDQLVQAKSELAALKVAEPACTKCGQPVETSLCWECAR